MLKTSSNTRALELCDVTLEDVDPKPSSPCFVGGLEDRDLTPRAREALLEAQRMFIENYCKFGCHGIFSMSLGSPALLGEHVHGHPIQDPTGALFTGLLVVRLNRPPAEAWMAEPHNMNLMFQTRQALAAIMSVCQKMAVHSARLNRETYIRVVLNEFMLPWEVPKWANDWEPQYSAFEAIETSIVTDEPVLNIMTQSPMAEAEVVIGELVVARKLSKRSGLVLRGGCFFLLGACLLNPDEDVLETLVEHLDSRTIGMGCVSVLLTLMHCMGLDYDGTEIKDGETLYRAPYSHAVDRVAQVILKNARSPHANQLRIGPYRANVHPNEDKHVVQRLCAPLNLERAAHVFLESMRCDKVQVVHLK